LPIYKILIRIFCARRKTRDLKPPIDTVGSGRVLFHQVLRTGFPVVKITNNIYIRFLRCIQHKCGFGGGCRIVIYTLNCTSWPWRLGHHRPNIGFDLCCGGFAVCIR